MSCMGEPANQMIDVILPLEQSEDREAWRRAVATRLRVEEARITGLELRKHSIDARRRQIKVQLRFEVGLDGALPVLEKPEACYPELKAGAPRVVKGKVIIGNPLTILWIAIGLFIQTMLMFWLGYGVARLLKLRYMDAAPAAMIGASNHFEVAIATSTMLFGLSSGAALATVVGVLIEVPVMLMLVKICLKTTHWFKEAEMSAAAEQPTTV